MSARSNNGAGLVLRAARGSALASLLALLAACAATGPRDGPEETGTDALGPVAVQRDTASGSDAVTGPASSSAATSEAETSDGRRSRSRREARARRRQAGRDAANDETEAPESAPVPAAALAAHERAIAAIQAEDWTEAELELEQLTAGYPDYPGPYVNLAIVYRHDRRDALARETLDKALALDPMHPAANNRLGMLLREAGDFDAAEAAYRRAIDADPGYRLAWYNLGILLDLYRGRRAEALTAYETFQSLGDEPDAEVGRWIIDLRRRLGDAAPPERVAREDGT